MEYKTRGFVLWSILLASLVGPLVQPVHGVTEDGGHLEVSLTPAWTTGIVSDGVGLSNIVVTDLNQDHVADIVACSIGSVFVLNETGAGGYDTTWFSEQLPCNEVAVGELATGGDKAILVGGGGPDPRLVILDGQTFEKLGEVTLVGDYRIFDLEAGDVDADGDVELVLVTSGATYVYDANTLELEWKATDKGGTEVGIGDIDGDNAPEIVVNSDPAHILNAQLQQEEWGYAGGLGVSMDLGDVDDDGISEIAFVTGGGESESVVQVFEADTLTTKWQSERFGMGIVEVGDTSGDGIPEVLVGDGQWGVLTGYQGDTGAELWTIANPELGVDGLGVGDADNDGVIEVLWGAGYTHTGKDALFVGDWVSESVEWGSADLDGPLYVAAGDVDADGQVEIVMASQSTDAGYMAGIIRVYNGATHELEWSVVTSDWIYDLYQVAVGQLDADPAEEIVVGALCSYKTCLAVYDGISRERQWQIEQDVQGPPTGLFVANLDADAVDEIIVGLSNQSVQVYNGASPVVQWTSETLDRDIKDLAIGDLDGNSVLDLAVLTWESVYVFEAGTWMQRSAPAPSGATQLAIANDDLSGPGELLILEYTTSGTNLLTWNADLAFLRQRSLGQLYILEMSTGELDGDGDDEYVVMGLTGSNWYDYGPSLLLIGSQISVSGWTEYEISGYWGSINGMVLADVDNDGQLELTYASNTLIQVNEISSAPLTIYTGHVPLVVRDW